MFAVTSHSCFWIYVMAMTCSQLGASVGQKNITAESGQNVTLTCQAPNSNIIVIDWRRADQYLLLYRDEQFDSESQHESFRNRVDLQDRQMKDGDVSLILKNVMINDTGTYKCRVKTGTNRKTALINNITLVVVAPPAQPGGATEDEDEEDGSVGLIVGLSVSALLFVAAAVGFVIYKKAHQRSESCFIPVSSC